MASSNQRSSRRRRPVPKYIDSSDEDPAGKNTFGSKIATTTAKKKAARAAVVAAAAAAHPPPAPPRRPPPPSPADDARFLQSLKTDVIGRVAARLAATAAAANGVGTGGAGDGALLATLAADFPFLGPALRDRDPAQLRALADDGFRLVYGGGSSGVAAASSSSAAAGAGAGAGRRAAVTPRNAVGGGSSSAGGGTKRNKRARKVGGSRDDVPAVKRSRQVDDDDGDEDYEDDDDDTDEDDAPPERMTATWAVRIEQCRAFREEHGHLKIPKNHPELGVWAAGMRVKRRKSLGVVDVSDKDREKLRELEELGFSFEYERQPSGNATAPSLWPERLQQCRLFKAEKGHLQISTNHPQLGKWAKKMRQLRRESFAGKTELSEQRRDKLRQLEELGFSFEYTKEPFDVKLAKLAEYKEKHGADAFPATADPVLGGWVEKVRREYSLMGKGEKSTYLTLERMRRLTDAGFVFRGRSPEVPWEERLEQLRKYKEENGHLRVPKIEALGRWVRRQRHQFNCRLDGKHSALTPERQKKLDDLGFLWETGQRPSPEALARMRTAGPHTTWDERLEEFKKFLAEHGHPYVPQVGDGSVQARALGRWVAKQRQKYRYMLEGLEMGNYGAPLTADRALKLANAGFAWDASHIHKTPKNSSEPLDGAVSADGFDHDSAAPADASDHEHWEG